MALVFNKWNRDRVLEIQFLSIPKNEEYQVYDNSTIVPTAVIFKADELIYFQDIQSVISIRIHELFR